MCLSPHSLANLKHVPYFYHIFMPPVVCASSLWSKEAFYHPFHSGPPLCQIKHEKSLASGSAAFGSVAFGLAASSLAASGLVSSGLVGFSLCQLMV